MRLRSGLGLVVLLTLTAGIARAAEAPAKRAITAEDLWAVKRPAALQLSPDGRRLVFAVKEYNLEKNNSVSHLWLLDTASGVSHPLTTADSPDENPTWSPDGQAIAFTSKRGTDKVASLYVIHPDGGEAEKVVELPLAVSSPRWLSGTRIVFETEVLPKLAGDPEAMKAELKKQEERKVTAKVTENGSYRYFDTWHTDGHAAHLVAIDLATKQTVDLTPRWDRLFTWDASVDFDVSPDGKWIALTAGTTPPPFRTRENPDVYLLSTEHPEAAWRNLTADNVGQDGSPHFTPDGSAILFTRKLHEDEGENLKLMRVDVASGAVTPLFPGLDLSVHDARPSPDGTAVYFTAEDHGRTKVYRAPLAGGTPVAVASNATNSALAPGDHAVFFLEQSFLRPDEVYGLDLASGTVSVRSHLNDTLFAGLKLGKVEEHLYPGAGGDPIELWMIYPPDFDPAKKYPLLVLMHGGPATMIGDLWQPRWNAQVFVTPGYVAAWMNRHGSTGFGEKFAQSIDGAWGEKPFDDIMKGTDYLLAHFPFLDATRTAALGASYGGYMATWVCGHTDRFKTIVCHDGVSDFNAQYGSDVAMYWQDRGMGGSPWHRTPAYEKENPINYADHFRTPTLIIQGGTDYRVPVDSALEFYAALQAQDVPARLVFFPDENHWVLHPQNSVFWYGQVHDWLGRWLKWTMLRCAWACALLLAALGGARTLEAQTAVPAADAAQEVAATLDRFHAAAARADGAAYFALFAPEAVFIGTDAGERWDLPQFRAFALPYFQKGKGWTYVPSDRHVQLSPQGDIAWFDEALKNADLGVCRGTGVLRRVDGHWLVCQYHLTIPVPNALAKDVVKLIRAQTPTVPARP